MNRFAQAVLVALAALCFCGVAFADPTVNFALGANGVWLSGPNAAFANDVEAGATAWSSLSPHASLVAHGFYGFNNQYIRYDGEARVTATDVDDPNFNVYLGMRYRGGSTDAVRPNEWAPDAGVGWCPSPQHMPRIKLGADAAYGLQSNRVISYAAIRYTF